jgi:hypothetical protein
MKTRIAKTETRVVLKEKGIVESTRSRASRNAQLRSQMRRGT